jgi:hypothetical protein
MAAFSETPETTTDVSKEKVEVQSTEMDFALASVDRAMTAVEEAELSKMNQIGEDCDE